MRRLDVCGVGWGGRGGFQPFLKSCPLVFFLFCCMSLDYLGTILHPHFFPLNPSLAPIVLAQLVSEEEDVISKVNLQRLIADCDVSPTQEDLDTLFNQVRDNSAQEGYAGFICRRPDRKVYKVCTLYINCSCTLIHNIQYTYA